MSALTNWRIYPHLLLTITAFARSFTLTSYAPSIVISYGYERLQSNALASVGTWIALVMSVTWGILADRTRCRGLWVLAGLVLWWGFMVCNVFDKAERVVDLTTVTARMPTSYRVDVVYKALRSSCPRHVIHLCLA